MAVLEEPEVHLQQLEVEFMAALELRTKGKSDEARQKLENVLRVDPRLPEPRLEMARIYLETQRLEDAETEAREALSLLQAGGQWVET
ncbi:MAG TPA: tetratricopeptide repeat protein, partial [Myxococcota bacterium]|nr:tetratricopeptide repeat protein [Myxococcota bacterium]